MLTQGAVALVRARRARGWTLQEVADLLGTSRAQVCKLEHGTRKPGRVTGGRLALLFGITLEAWDRAADCGE